MVTFLLMEVPMLQVADDDADDDVDDDNDDDSDDDDDGAGGR